VRKFDQHWLMEGMAREMIRVANTVGTYDGIATERNANLIDRCKGYHVTTGSLIIFTRDAGHHSSGWWKNPEYERCWHLSLSFVDPLTLKPRDKDILLTDKWIQAFYHDNKRYLWSESPFSPIGKHRGVWHYRVFCNEGWSPIIPKGEVYSKELTEAGWKSFSDLQSEHAKQLQELEALPGEQ
jgi:hypothetical protein